MSKGVKGNLVMYLLGGREAAEKREGFKGNRRFPLSNVFPTSRESIHNINHKNP
jgi:hypothetical protein